jgi:indole-3-glycerol phosphate synthase
MSVEGTYLEAIVAAKRAAIERPTLARRRDLESRMERVPPARDFEAALRRRPGPQCIAEFKRASPSEGVIRDDLPPAKVAQLYVDAGAAAISVLCDAHFHGGLDDLEEVHAAVEVPVLCKDFLLQPDQLVEARAYGADAALLIVACLEPPRLREMIREASELGMQVLCEAHTEHEIERALAAGARIIGVNNRDLHTFEVDVERSIQLRGRVPPSFTYVSESGLRSREDVQRMREAAVDAVLVGTHLMRAEDPGLALTDLMAMP